jgi:hypothetical protein
MNAESEVTNGYEVRQKGAAGDLAALYVYCAREEADWPDHHTVRDKILSLGTIALISACGWTVIIAIVRLLR